MSSDLHKRLLNSGISSLPPRMPPSSGGRSGGRSSQRSFSPLQWSDYFTDKKLINTDNGDSFNVYTCGDTGKGPILLLLHGGGYSGLTWSLFAKNVTEKVCCRVVAPDLRGHGESRASDELDLSASTMSNDVVEILRHFVSEKDNPGVVIVGHSMGGALAVHAALLGEIDNLLGICVIDVVEGTAMDALAGMLTFLRSRPSTFKSLSNAIEWSVRSGQVRNIESARVSMPGQLKSASNNQCATQCIGSDTTTEESLPHAKVPIRDPNAISEEPEMNQQEVQSTPSTDDASDKGFAWRIDLAQSEPHWTSWFSGLSLKFLSVNAAKLLLLAGVDRLDRDLTVGQMQGKFQMQLLPQAGHAVHEDVPDKVADVLATFLVRNKFATSKDSFQMTFPAC